MMQVSSCFADAIVVTKAMSASTIAEVFVENDHVRVELEIGEADVTAFANILSDEKRIDLNLPLVPSMDRISRFFRCDFVIEVDGQPLEGRVLSLAERKRIARDEITGEPLVLQPADAETVMFLELRYEMSGEPTTIAIQPPLNPKGFAQATIGFVAYFKSLPISDFRYLSQSEKLDLDWEDPWYSKFRNRNLWRQFDSPVSVFLYVEPFEVRKEIVVRPIDLQRWVDLGVDIDGEIAIEDQAELKQHVAEFVKDKHQVLIDGVPVTGIVDRIHFIRRSLKKTGVVYPDEHLAAVSATLGIIVVYPIDALPDQVSMEWEMFDERLSEIPASTIDEAGGLPTRLTPSDPELVWKNYLTNPTTPAMKSVPVPPRRNRWSIPVITVACLLCGAVVGVLSIGAKERRRMFAVTVGVLLLIGLLTWPLARVSIADPFDEPFQLQQEQADEVVASLMHNMYHAFQFRQESLIYDQLANSLTDEALRQVYLQLLEQMKLEGQGGATVNIDRVELIQNEVVELDENGMLCRCQWSISGTIGHWGHIHRRDVAFGTDLDVRPVGDRWKIGALMISDIDLAEVTN